MADNVTTQSGTLATVPASTVIATDDSGGAHYQIVEIADATTPTQRLAIDSSGRITALISGSLSIAQNPIRVSVTPTISTSIYAAGDSIGGEMTIANAAASSGGYGLLRSVVIGDKDNERAEMDILFFDRAQTGTATDQSPFDPADADLANFVGSISVLTSHYNSFSDNAGAVVPCSVPIKCNATSLFAYAVALATPTYTSTSDLTFHFSIERY